MLEILELKNSTEQNISVVYGSRTIIYELRWNPLHEYWYYNAKENEQYFLRGVTMTTNANLMYDKFDLGKLYLIDTMEGATTEPIKKEDLGGRLALAREY